MIDDLRIGYTLSQVALAEHLYVTRSWIRRKGDRVFARGETWRRLKYQSGRCAGYELVAKS